MKERKCQHRKDQWKSPGIGKEYQWSNCRIQKRAFAGIRKKMMHRNRRGDNIASARKKEMKE